MKPLRSIFHNLCVALAESDKQEFLPPIFHLPLVAFTMNHVRQHCGRKLVDQARVFIASNNVSLEKQIVPLLKCFNRTTSKLKTKHILVLDFFEDNNSNYCEDYSNFFQNLWNVFGIINIAILPVKGKRLETDPQIIFSYTVIHFSHVTTPALVLSKRKLSVKIYVAL